MTKGTQQPPPQKPATPPPAQSAQPPKQLAGAKAAAAAKAAQVNGQPPPANFDPDSTVAGYLERRKHVLGEVAAGMLDPARVVKLVVLQLRKNPRLGKCDPASVFNAVLELTRLGLEPGGAMGQAALVPYGPECNAQVMYQGHVELAYRSGLIKDINTKVVHVGDVFEWEEGENAFIRHRPSLEPGREKRAWTHVYCIINTTNGGVVREVMDQDGVFRIRGFSKDFQANGAASVWAQHELQMSRKTVFLRASKYAPKSAEMRAAQALEQSDVDVEGRTISETPRPPPDDLIMQAAMKALEPPTVKETLEQTGPKEEVPVEQPEQEGPPGEEPPPVEEELPPTPSGEKL